MSVVFFPDFSESNPYQLNLAAALESTGTRVEMGESGGLLPMLRSFRTSDEMSIAHIHWWHPYLFWESRVLTVAKTIATMVQIAILRILGVRIVWTVHNITAHQSSYPEVERWFKYGLLRYGFVDHLFVHCDDTTNLLAEEYGVSEPLNVDVSVIPHGHYIGNYENTISPTEARAEIGIDSVNTVFLFFGQIKPYKSITQLINAFRTIDNEDYRLLVVGNPENENLCRRIDSLAVSDDRIHTRFEFVPDGEIQRYMNASNVVVLPYDDILNSGTAVLAMSFGKALIVPRAGCLPSLVHEQGVIWYDTNDGLVDVLRGVKDHDLEAMGECNFTRVAEYAWEDIARQTAVVYRAVH